MGARGPPALTYSTLLGAQPMGFTSVFSNDFSPQWFFKILDELVIPFRNEFEGSPFWFTRYRCPESFDIGAEELSELRKGNGFIQNSQHVSLRFRFASDDKRRTYLEKR